MECRLTLAAIDDEAVVSRFPSGLICVLGVKTDRVVFKRSPLAWELASERMAPCGRWASVKIGIAADTGKWLVCVCPVLAC